MDFYSISNPPPIVGEENIGKSLVEEYGNISSKNLITNLIASGKAPLRATLYDTDGTTSGDEIDIDPTRSGSFDLADATAIQQELSAAQEAAASASTDNKTTSTTSETKTSSTDDSGELINDSK